MSSTETSGRFLPSRIYSRWKWAIRFGLLLVPFLILLSGGITLFGLENGPPPQEIVELVKSRSVLARVVDRLQ